MNWISRSQCDSISNQLGILLFGIWCDTFCAIFHFLSIDAPQCMLCVWLNWLTAIILSVINSRYSRFRIQWYVRQSTWINLCMRKLSLNVRTAQKLCNQRPISTAQSDSAITPTHRNSLGSSCNVHNWHDCYICNLLWIYDPMRVATEFGIFSLFYQKNRTWMMIGILTEFQEKTRKTCHYSPIITVRWIQFEVQSIPWVRNNAWMWARTQFWASITFYRPILCHS